MAKDPAVLFYTSDFLSGTITMPDDERGRYIMLLCLQHQQIDSKLSEAQFNAIAKESDSQLREKFKTEGGKVFNERMLFEADKRKKYSESRRNNRKKKTEETYDKDMNNHMSIHMENENEDINSIKDTKEKKRKYGEYKHVLLTDVQHSRLLSEWGHEKLDSAIKILDEGIQMKGYKYKDFNLALRRWEKNSTQSTHTKQQSDASVYASPPPKRGTCRNCEEEEQSLLNGLCPMCRAKGVK